MSAQVLLIECDPLLARNVTGALTRRGHSAIATADAQAAINAADACTPDVIIMDILLAGRSGIELLYELRSYPEWQSLPVIVYSNLAPTELPAAAATELGIQKAFYKPLARLSDLIDAVERLATPATASGDAAR